MGKRRYSLLIHPEVVASAEERFHFWTGDMSTPALLRTLMLYGRQCLDNEIYEVEAYQLIWALDTSYEKSLVIADELSGQDLRTTGREIVKMTIDDSVCLDGLLSEKARGVVVNDRGYAAILAAMLSLDVEVTLFDELMGGDCCG